MSADRVDPALVAATVRDALIETAARMDPTRASIADSLRRAADLMGTEELLTLRRLIR